MKKITFFFITLLVITSFMGCEITGGSDSDSQTSSSSSSSSSSTSSSSGGGLYVTLKVYNVMDYPTDIIEEIYVTLNEIDTSNSSTWGTDVLGVGGYLEPGYVVTSDDEPEGEYDILIWMYDYLVDDGTWYYCFFNDNYFTAGDIYSIVVSSTLPSPSCDGYNYDYYAKKNARKFKALK